MLKQRRDGVETRGRLLDAACRVFGEKGFRAATIAEICRQAGANIAAANYYFGGKESLYVESWRHSLARSFKAHPPYAGVPASAPAEERLRGWILSVTRRITDPGSHVFDIVHKEMANPTGLLKDAMAKEVGPLRREFMSLVRELLGGRATERQVRFCHMSIMAQCFGPLLRERGRAKGSTMPCAHEERPLAGDVEALADHVTRFSLAGLREVRKENARRMKSDSK